YGQSERDLLGGVLTPGPFLGDCDGIGAGGDGGVRGGGGSSATGGPDGDGGTGISCRLGSSSDGDSAAALARASRTASEPIALFGRAYDKEDVAPSRNQQDSAFLAEGAVKRRRDWLLLRLVDDFLLITTSRERAVAFVRTMHDSRLTDPHGIRINKRKTLVNFDVTIPLVGERVATIPSGSGGSDSADGGGGGISGGGGGGGGSKAIVDGKRRSVEPMQPGAEAMPAAAATPAAATPLPGFYLAKRVDGAFPWAGLRFDTQTCAVLSNYERYAAVAMAATISADLGPRPGVALRQKMTRLLSQRCRGLLYDPAVNPPEV
ncbi:unnamed protein product, partial [Phaeothamnion confervicola]